MTDTTRPTSIDALLKAIADCRRRQVMYVLRESDEERSLERLATEIGNGDGSPEGDGTSIEQTKVSLCHHHLPKLADCGIVTWDQSRGEVSPGPAFDTVESLLRSLQDHSESLPADAHTENGANAE